MNAKSLTIAVIAGIAAFLVVGLAVTALTEPRIEFSLLLGIPAGLVAGAFTAAAVYFGSADDAPARRRRIAGAFAGFGTGFLIAFVVLGLVLESGVSIALIAAVIIGLVVGITAYLRGPKREESPGTDSGSDSVTKSN